MSYRVDGDKKAKVFSAEISGIGHDPDRSNTESGETVFATRIAVYQNPTGPLLMLEHLGSPDPNGRRKRQSVCYVDKAEFDAAYAALVPE